jgi:chromate reductase
VTLISYLNMDIMNVPRVAIPNTNKPPDGSDTPTPLTENPFLIAQIDAFIEFISEYLRRQ